MQQRHIHFVCRGNVYRSRLALLYALKNYTGSHLTFSCSGIEAEKYYPDVHAISPLIRNVASHYGLDLRQSPRRIQATDELLEQADLIVFMHPDVLRDAKKAFNFNIHKSQSWDISDWDDPANKHRAQDWIAEETYQKIMKCVDELICDTTQLGWVDIVDRDNRELGYELPISWASQDPDIWHRSCHAIITTPAGYVVQKRAANIILSPGRLDISVGGAVDAGETPEQAIIREIYEELGVKVDKDELVWLDQRRWSRVHPKFKRYSRNHLTTFHIHVNYTPHFMTQSSEIAEVRILKRGQLRYLLMRHRFPRFGELNYPYAFYKEMVKRTREHV